MVNRLIFAAALMAGITPVIAQQLKTIPSGTVIGRSQVGVGPAQAIPFSQLIALLLQSTPTIPSLNTNSIVFKGSTSGQATVQAQAVASTPTLNLPTTSGTIPSTATSPITLDAVTGNIGCSTCVTGVVSRTGTSPIVVDPSTGNISCPSCATGVSASSPVVASRAIAQTMDLSALSVVQTLGYATAGDGGGAVFKKVAAGTPFTDQTINTTGPAPTLVGGSGYVNGTYLGVPLTGGHGLSCAGEVIVSGGAVTGVGVAIPCPGYAVGDVLTTPNTAIGGSGSGFTWTVTNLNVAMGSFVDAVGNLWQITTDQGNKPNVLQFGAVGNWNGSDSGITNSRPAFWSAIGYSMYPQSASAAEVNGNTLYVPKGAYLICGGTGGATLAVPQGVTLEGAGRWGGTSVIQCAIESQNNHGIWLCDPLALSGQFGCEVRDLLLNTSEATSASNVFAFASTSGQQFELLHDVGVIAGQRGCVFYDYGRGGAANTIFNGGECTQSQGAGNTAFVIGANVGGDLVTVRDWVFECGGSGCNHDSIVTSGTPFAVFQGIHIEANADNGFNVSQTGGTLSIRDLSMSGPCLSAFTLQGSNPASSVLLENINSSCTSTVTGRTSASGSILGQRVF